MKKIMFNDKYGLTQAVLDGRKTMTRRLIPKLGNVNDINWGIGNNGKTMITIEALSWDGLITEDIYPQYQVGEVVAVAQAYKELYPNADFRMVGDEFMTESVGWKNKMFVRADVMPHQIRIENIRVERLRDISSADCLAEGVLRALLGYYIDGLKVKDWAKEAHRETDHGCMKLFHTPRLAYAALIDKISGKGTWESNPLVYAYDFKLIK